MGLNYFNFEQPPVLPGQSALTKNYFIDWLSSDAGKRAMHAGPNEYNPFNATVEVQLLGDWMVGVVPYLLTLLEADYKVLIYSGQNDVILGAPLTENALRSPAFSTWSSQQAFEDADKKAWRVGDDLAGYARTVGNFAYVVVRGAGHMVPTDQPVRALDLITRLVEGKF